MSANAPQPPRPEPGWYELPGEQDVERYWDGVTWSHNVRIKKSVLKRDNFFLFLYPHLIKWYSLVAVLIAAALVVSVVVTQNSPISSAETASNSKYSVMSACNEVLGYDWYPLNAREFAHAPDVAARKSNVVFTEALVREAKAGGVDSRFIELATSLSKELQYFSNTKMLGDAVIAAAAADMQFASLSSFCETVGAKGVTPVISESTENSSEIEPQYQARIPEGYIDNGSGLAYSLSLSGQCPESQYGCTRIELFAYRACPGGVHVYADFYNVSGGPVAVTDAQTEPLQSGQSTVVNLSTGLSTANNAVPNNFVCE
jgi:hypothetical protein